MLTSLPPKHRFASQPEIYASFLSILQAYLQKSTPIKIVYAQVTQLLSTAPDLVEVFKHFLPPSAARTAAPATRITQRSML